MCVHVQENRQRAAMEEKKRKREEAKKATPQTNKRFQPTAPGENVIDNLLKEIREGTTLSHGGGGRKVSRQQLSSSDLEKIKAMASQAASVIDGKEKDLGIGMSVQEMSGQKTVGLIPPMKSTSEVTLSSSTNESCTASAAKTSSTEKVVPSAELQSLTSVEVMGNAPPGGTSTIEKIECMATGGKTEEAGFTTEKAEISITAEKRAEPGVTTENTELSVKTATIEPAVTAANTEPAVTAATTEPAVTAANTESAVTDEKIELDVIAENVEPPVVAELTKLAIPTVTAENTEPAVMEEKIEPAVTADKVEPTVTADKVEPTVTADKVEPTVMADKVEPTVTADKVEPAVTADKVEPDVTQMAEPAVTSEPSISVEKTVDAVVKEKQTEIAHNKTTTEYVAIMGQTENSITCVENTEPAMIAVRTDSVSTVEKTVAKRNVETAAEPAATSEETEPTIASENIEPTDTAQKTGPAVTASQMTGAAATRKPAPTERNSNKKASRKVSLPTRGTNDRHEESDSTKHKVKHGLALVSVAMLAGMPLAANNLSSAQLLKQYRRKSLGSATD